MKEIVKALNDCAGTAEEPDFAFTEDPETGIYVAIVKRSGGYYCGYVGVGERHPYYNEDEIFGYAVGDLNVHGGVTFTGPKIYGPQQEPIETEEDVWWIGFDCAHAGDLVPSLTNLGCGYHTDIPRDFAYVVKECKTLFDQIVEAK